jgi:excisionase family DNA binding protein
MNMADDVPVAPSGLNGLLSTAGARKHEPSAAQSGDSLPLLLTPREAASVLRVTAKAIYTMIERGQLPGVIRVGRRLRIDTRVLLHWLDRKCAPSPKE